MSLSSGAGELTSDLFEEGNWTTCSIEARRILLERPDDEWGRFLFAASTLRQHVDSGAASILSALERQASCSNIRSRAALELARMEQCAGNHGKSWNHAAEAFMSTPDTGTFLQSLALMQHTYRHSGAALRLSPALEMQYLTCEPLLRQVPANLCPPPPESIARRIGTTPGRLIVAFYRRCVRPALGERCSLSPNCSEYFLQATGRHGLLGIPMIADRLVREPSVVAAALHPFVKGRRTVYQDPVEYHDFWMESP